MCPSSRPQFPFPLPPSFLTKVPVLRPCCMPSSWLARISCPCSLTLSTSITFLVSLIIFPSLVLVTRPSILRLQRSYFHWKKLRFPGETLPKFLPAAKLIQETFVPVHLHRQLVCFCKKLIIVTFWPIDRWQTKERKVVWLVRCYKSSLRSAAPDLWSTRRSGEAPILFSLSPLCSSTGSMCSQ